MAGIIYTLCTITAFACAWMLLKNYMKQKHRILLWGGLCFSGLFINNLLLVIDRLVLPNIDLSMFRLITGLISLLFLIYGLIWEEDKI